MWQEFQLQNYQLTQLPNSLPPDCRIQIPQFLAPIITIVRMSFSGFHGNPEVVRRLREVLARGRFPNSVILAGPEGAGKYTLALMLARAMNCLQPIETDGLPDYCGVCNNCRRIGESEDMEARFTEAVEARDGLRETDKRETRILVQTHPD